MPAECPGTFTGMGTTSGTGKLTSSAKFDLGENFQGNWLAQENTKEGRMARKVRKWIKGTLGKSETGDEGKEEERRGEGMVQELKEIEALANACCPMYRALNVSQKFKAQYKISAGVTYRTVRTYNWLKINIRQEKTRLWTTVRYC